MMTDKNSWKHLRQNAPLLSYSLLFQPPGERGIMADILSLGLEFDFILSQASEPMLALIRLKWWEEQIAAANSVGPDLLGRINSHIARGTIRGDDINRLITCWQDYAEEGNSPDKAGQKCWAEIIALCGKISHLPESPLFHQIGSALYNSRNGLDIGIVASAREIDNIYKKNAEFLIALAYLARRGGDHTLPNDHLILFKILWQVLARPSA
jgi:hypothetical protein